MKNIYEKMMMTIPDRSVHKSDVRLLCVRGGREKGEDSIGRIINDGKFMDSIDGAPFTKKQQNILYKETHLTSDRF